MKEFRFVQSVKRMKKELHPLGRDAKGNYLLINLVYDVSELSPGSPLITNIY